MVNLKKKELLIVDDEDKILDNLEDMLSEEGAIVHRASGGHEALEFLQKRKIDMLISDLRMPNGDGNELIRLAIEANISPPHVILLTAFPQDIDFKDEVIKGAYHLVVKPVRHNELMMIMEQCFDGVEKNLVRKYDRVDVDLETEIINPDSKISTNVRTFNISHGGFFFVTDEDFPGIGDEVEFKVKFADQPEKNIEGIGEVRWLRLQGDEKFPKGVGVRFKEIK